MRRYLIFIFSVLMTGNALQAQSESRGSIMGRLTDKEMEGEPLPFANVLLKGTSKGATTDLEGIYAIEKLEPGKYTVVFSFIGYETRETLNIEVVAGKVTEINAELGSSAAALDEVVISTVSRRDSEVALLLEQKKAVVIKQSIGAEELSRKGVSNVEQGLSKISGITTVEDRGTFVRGLDDRYNFLLVNGLPIASSDPDFKIIPLNYISTNIVSSIDVLKTFNASLYQDFAGATFEVKTTPAPSRPTTILNVGVKYNSITTFKDFYYDDSSELEFLGYTGDNRALPAAFGEDVLSYTATPEESEGLFESSWTPEKITAPLANSFGISHGQRLISNEHENLGFYFSLNYDNSYHSRQGVERTLNSEGTAGQNFNSVTYDFSTQKSALISLDYDRIDRFQLKFNTIYLQNSSNFIREAFGRNDGFTQLNNRDFFIRDARYTENDNLIFQLYGNTDWQDKKHQLEVAGSVGIGNNQVPDRRVLRAAGTGEDAEYITTNGINPFRFFQTLENSSISAKAEYSHGLQKDENLDFSSHLKVGYNLNAIEYDFFNRTITAQVDNINLPNLNTNDPQVFFNRGFSEGFLRYSSTFDPAARSQINQVINAGYLILQKQWEKLLIDAGLRAEYASRQISYRNPLDRPDSPYKELNYEPFDLSPSLNIKYDLGENSNLRLAASVTSTRPRLREILPTVYQDGDGNQVIGNPTLKNSRNYNVDLKYEVFPENAQLLAFTVFGKYIQDPIERLARSTSVGYRTFFDNFDEAVLYGVELEARFNASSIFENTFADRFSFGFNGILMDSEATAAADDPRFAAVTNKNRRLQGASNWGINADVLYQIFKRGNTASSVNLIYNTFGERIYAVGVEGADEIYERPLNQLDLVWATQFNKSWDLKLTARNLLNEETLFYQDPTRDIRFPNQFSNVIESFNTGTTYGASLTYKF